MSALLEATGLALPGRLSPTDLRVEQPELVCLVGPNGSGKTSLLHALAGIGAPDGSVRIEGIARHHAGPTERRRLLAYLPASREAAWPLTVRDLVALGLAGKHRESEAEAALAALELVPFAERRIGHLSTGERSRALIARALAPKPRLLLLDEPVANLDPLWQLKLMDLLKRLVAGGQGVLIALHDLDLAARYADRLIVMEHGCVRADGDAAALVESDIIPAVFRIRQVNGGWRPV